MRIDRVQPKPPPEVTMTFSTHEGWCVLAALNEWIRNHPGAAEIEKWKEWSADLDRALRR